MCLQKQVFVSEAQLVCNLTSRSLCLYERGPEGQGNTEMANSCINENTGPDWGLRPVSSVIFTCELQVFISFHACICFAWGESDLLCNCDMCGEKLQFTHTPFS